MFLCFCRWCGNMVLHIFHSSLIGSHTDVNWLLPLLAMQTMHSIARRCRLWYCPPCYRSCAQYFRRMGPPWDVFPRPWTAQDFCSQFALCASDTHSRPYSIVLQETTRSRQRSRVNRVTDISRSTYTEATPANDWVWSPPLLVRPSRDSDICFC